MLDPNFFYGKSDKLLEYYYDLEDWLLKDMATFLLNAGELTGTLEREFFLLKQMGMNNTEIYKKLSQTSKLSQREVKNILKESVVSSYENDKRVLDHIGLNHKAPFKDAAIVDVINAEVIKCNGLLDNLTKTTIAQANTDLLNLLNQAEIRVASGSQSYSAAVCDVLDSYAKTGIRVSFMSGATKSLESAVRCAVVTSMNQTAAQVTNKYIAEGEIEYVIISAHTGARHDKNDPTGLGSHDWWQGKVFKIRGESEGYPNLLESTGYDIDPITGEGTVVDPRGLHGYNCRHSHQPWDLELENPWIDEDGYYKVDPAESLKVYQEQQEQRALERDIRNQKRKVLMKDAEIRGCAETDVKTILQKDYDKLAYKLRKKNEAYEKFCERHKLSKQYDRIKVGGFGSAQSSRANGRATAYENSL